MLVNNSPYSPRLRPHIELTKRICTLFLGTSSPDQQLNCHSSLSSPERYSRLRIIDPHGEDRHEPDPHPLSRRRTLVICMVQG